MPALSGDIQLAVSGPVTVTRDALGVAHIQGTTVEDVLFAQGYVTAQDRLWQMDAIRRLGSGELAEVAGAAALELDRDSRRLRMRRAAEDHARTMPAADRAHLAAFARGVNAYIDANRSKLPIEFRLLGYQPRPWVVADSIVIAMHMYRSLTTTWKDEIAKRQMSMAGDPARVAQLYPIRTGGEFQPGSNAWVLSGARTATGKPILANDPHLEFSFPATWYQVRLEGGGLNVTGVSLPGVPGVVIGHNQRIAWGMTNLGYDVQDLYIESLDLNTGRYQFRNTIEQARVETETIAVKGARPVVMQQYITRHGPAIANEDGMRWFALRWTATEPGTFQFPIIEVNRAVNWTEFRAAVKRFPGPGQNFVFADVDGNIGYQASGLLPVRKNYDGDLPTDGAKGETEWDGFIPFENLPSSYNPASGMIVTANQNPWPENPGFRLNGEFAPPYRAVQIRALLERKKGWKPGDMLAVQADVYSPFLHHLASHFVRAWEIAKKPSSSEIALLKSWNGQMDKDSAAAFLMALAYEQLKRGIAESAAPGKSAQYEAHIAAGAIERLVVSRPAGWFPSWDAQLAQVLNDAIEEARRIQGQDSSKWRYGLYWEFNMPHGVLGRIPFLDKVPFLGGRFNLGPVPMSGSSTTVKQTTRRMGPSMRFIADLSNWDNSLNNITVGQSGHAMSSHFRDQWQPYLNATSFPMQFRTITPADTLRIAPLK